MVHDLKKLTPRFSFFLNDWKNLFLMRGGTVHTAVRQKRFYTKLNGISMARWLGDAVEGKTAGCGDGTPMSGVIEKFGSYVSGLVREHPERARKLLVTAYRERSCSWTIF